MSERDIEELSSVRKTFKIADTLAPHPDDVIYARGTERSKAKVVIGFLGWMGLLSLGTTIQGAWLWSLAKDASAGLDVADAALRFEGFAQVVNVTKAVSLLVTGILFIQWMRLVTRHARQFGIHHVDDLGMTMDVSEVTWGCLIPIINFIQPYRAMRQMRAVSQPDILPTFEVERPVESVGYRQAAVARERLERPPVFVPLGIWWAFYVLGKVLNRVIRHWSPDGVEGYVDYGLAIVANGVVWLAAAVAAALFVRGVLVNRTELYRRLEHWAKVIDDEDAASRKTPARIFEPSGNLP